MPSVSIAFILPLLLDLFLYLILLSPFSSRPLKSGYWNLFLWLNGFLFFHSVFLIIHVVKNVSYSQKRKFQWMMWLKRLKLSYIYFWDIYWSIMSVRSPDYRKLLICYQYTINMVELQAWLHPAQVHSSSRIWVMD